MEPIWSQSELKSVILSEPSGTPSLKLEQLPVLGLMGEIRDTVWSQFQLRISQRLLDGFCIFAAQN